MHVIVIDVRVLMDNWRYGRVRRAEVEDVAEEVDSNEDGAVPTFPFTSLLYYVSSTSGSSPRMSNTTTRNRSDYRQ